MVEGVTKKTDPGTKVVKQQNEGPKAAQNAIARPNATIPLKVPIPNMNFRPTGPQLGGPQPYNTNNA